MAEASTTTEALILDRRDGRDDRVLVLLTPDSGRLAGLARRGRRSQRRFGAHAEPLTRSELVLRERRGRELHLVERARTLEAMSRLKGDLARWALGCCMAETVLAFVPEGAHEEGIYPLLLRALRHLDRPDTEPREELLLLFELRMLALTGHLADAGELPGVPDEARAALAAWLAGRWRPLPAGTRRAVARALEGRTEDATGHALRSRPFLDRILDGAAGG